MRLNKKTLNIQPTSTKEAHSFMNTRLPRTLLVAVFSCSLLFVVGCGSKGHDRTEVSGMVTLDGESLPSGLTIKFTPQESGKPVGQGGVDVKSRYFIYGAPGEIGLNPGTYTVSVEVPFADEPGPYSGPPELAKVKIPEAYQTGKSTLTYTAPSGGGTFNIEMVSK